MALDSHITRVMAAVAAAVIFPIAVVESIAAYRLPARVASADDWTKASARVRKDFASGDLLVFAPAWVDQIGRSKLGDLMPVEMIARSSDDAYGRVWVVGVRGARAELPASAKLVSSEQLGQLTVSLYEKPAVKILYDFVAHFEAARVTLVRNEERPCLGDGEARKCGQSRIERRTAEVDYQPRRAILVPVEAGATTRLEYDVELGSKLVVYVGLHDYYARKSADGKLDVRIAIDGQEKRHVEHRNDGGWERVELDTRGLTGQHTVRFDVSAKAAVWRIGAIAAEVQQ